MPLSKSGKRPKPSRLQSELARKILRLLKDEGAAAGHHLVELDLCDAFGVSRTRIRPVLGLAAGTVVGTV